jgi:hypothetical protein
MGYLNVTSTSKEPLEKEKKRKNILNLTLPSSAFGMLPPGSCLGSNDLKQ